MVLPLLRPGVQPHTRRSLQYPTVHTPPCSSLSSHLQCVPFSNPTRDTSVALRCMSVNLGSSFLYLQWLVISGKRPPCSCQPPSSSGPRECILAPHPRAPPCTSVSRTITAAGNLVIHVGCAQLQRACSRRRGGHDCRDLQSVSRRARESGRAHGSCQFASASMCRGADDGGRST